MAIPLATSGVDGATRRRLFAPTTPGEIIELLSSSSPSQDLLVELRWLQQRASSQHLLLIDGIDPKDLGQTGWGVIFAQGCDPEIREALSHLLELRKAQAGDLVQELEYQGETKLAFLARHGAPPGPVNPSRLPYYLLLVGSPHEIPFEFQYELDLQYAIGRLHFDDSEQYASYAQSVVAAESELSPCRAAFACASIDSVTERVRDGLVHPLMADLATRVGDWKSLCPEPGTTASKSRLRRLLGGEDTPSLLFAAGHGLGYRSPHPRQHDTQGALICDEWPRVTLDDHHVSDQGYLAARDIDDQADLGGLIAFLFSCFSAGLPRTDDFAHRNAERNATGPPFAPFVAALPRRLLSHPSDAALAVVGHVDRLWTYSFDWPLVGSYHDTFTDALTRLLDGFPLGWAMEPFSQRYAELALALLSEPPAADSPDLLRRSALLTAAHDARNFIVVGDPAVRLNTRHS